MVWWAEEIAASGYNKYTVLKMTHELSWDNGLTKHWAFLSGPGTQAIQDTLKSSSINSLYRERTTLYTIITPYAADLKKESYIVINSLSVTPNPNYVPSIMAFVVTDVDFISTPGVIYVSIDPSYIREHTVAQDGSVPENNSFWMNPQ